MTGEDPIERARRLAEIATGRLDKISKQQEHIKRMTRLSSSAMDAVRAEQERMERLTAAAQPQIDFLRRWRENNPAHFLQREMEKINSASELLRAAEAAMTRPAILEQAERARERLETSSSMLNIARLIEHSSLAQMAEKMADQVNPLNVAIEGNQLWQSRLESQMRAITIPWVRPEIAGLSAEGFAVVSRLNAAVRHEAPFDEEASELVNDDLGNPIEIEDDAEPEARDAAHVEAGMHPGMLAFAPPAVGEILIQTGFNLTANYAPIPTTTDGSDPGLIFHPGHNALITSVEQHLRSLISTKMSEHYGGDWLKKRVDPKIISEWKQRREEAVAKGEASLELLQYSYLMDLKDIIIGRQHWREVFHEVFVSKEHFSVSMERLHPIRLPLSHGRPIGTGQQFHLISEAGRILGAMGIDVFKK